MAKFKHAPIDRDEALAPLSRDHYVGLVLAHHLIRAAAEDDVARRQAVEELIDVWDREIAVHLRDEERLLSEFMDKADHQRLLDEHKRLTDLASRVYAARRQVDPDSAVLREFGQLLEEHIRWEERELFNRIEDRLDTAQLAELQKKTAAIEAARPRNISRNGSDPEQPGA